MEITAAKKPLNKNMLIVLLIGIILILVLVIATVPGVTETLRSSGSSSRSGDAGIDKAFGEPDDDFEPPVLPGS